jgi:hypothetical protein
MATVPVLAQQLDPGVDPAALPEEVQAVLMNPLDAVAGERRDFYVTAAGSSPGPMPTPAASLAPEGPSFEEPFPSAIE